ncbi:hypothetical protein [Kitasatospora sp. NPDC058478]|uniref:hypothetical protein n=1 Tax=unclassified Kitasatospora TaxID=2633591 RepID=UPI0036611564
MSASDDEFFEQMGHLVDAVRDGRAATDTASYESASKRAGEAAEKLKGMEGLPPNPEK